MALFSVNQNGQWFTAKAYQASALSAVGDILINSDNQTSKSAAKKIWFEYKDVAGNKRSEVINKANGGRITVVPAAVMAHTAKYVKLSMNSNVNSGNPVIGQIYGLYINQRNYHGLGDNQFGELGAEVRANSGATTSTLMRDLAVSFYNNLGSDQDLYKVYLEKNASGTLTLVEVVGANGAHTVDPSTYSDTYQAIFIAEKEQDWIQGTMQRENVNLSTDYMFLSSITYNTMEVNNWGTLAEVKTFESYGANTISVGTPVIYSGTLYETSTAHSSATWSSGHFTTTSHTIATWVNTKDIADMEWFYLGEHGDTQRLVGYPYANAATINGSIYKVDPTNTYGYDLVIIHHNYVGNGTFVQKSEQDIMIAMPLAGATTHTVANAFLDGLDDYFTSLSSSIGSTTETIEF